MTDHGDDHGDDICAICHENINVHDTSQLYELPECKHYYHTNCILTWFRAGHNRCPLCNNMGSNTTMDDSSITNELDNYSWQYRRKLLNDDYIMMRRFSKKKDAPIELKNKVKKLIKEEEKLKKIKKKSK